MHCTINTVFTDLDSGKQLEIPPPKKACLHHKQPDCVAGYTMKNKSFLLLTLQTSQPLSKETVELLILKCGISTAKAAVMVNGCP